MLRILCSSNWCSSNKSINSYKLVELFMKMKSFLLELESLLSFETYRREDV